MRGVHKMYYTYQMFTDDCYRLVDEIETAGKKYDYIVGIARGGSIPAVYLSHRLDLPMKNVSWSTFHAEQMRESAIDVADDIFDGKKILLVDDILDSGRTMKELIDDWGCKREDIDIAVLIYNVGQPIIPTFYGRLIDKRINNEWIDFWWETDQLKPSNK